MKTMHINEGYIELPRSFFESPLWLSEQFNDATAYLDMLSMAQDDDVIFFTPKPEVLYKKGQFSTSFTQLAKRWKWTERKVINFLAKEETSGVITVCHDENANEKEAILILINEYENSSK